MFSMPLLDRARSAGLKIAARKIQIRLLAKLPKGKDSKGLRVCVQRPYIFGIF